jgi:hypothetical protein
MTLPGPSPIREFNPQDFFPSLVETSKNVLLHPTVFFDGMKKDGGFRNPFIYLTVCVAVQTLLASILLGNPSIIPRNLAFGMVFPMLTAAILFFIIGQLFKTPGTYEMAFRVNAYAGAVSLFSWIPLMGMILELYRLYLIGIGLTYVFSIKGSRALLALLLTLIVYIVLSGAVAHLAGGKLLLSSGL